MITIDLTRCSGCSRCQVHCAFFHSGAVGRSAARIRVVKEEGCGLDVPVVCQQCRERYCRRCPEKALGVGPFGEIVVSDTLCTGCGTCAARCPIGAIELAGGLPVVCDLCGGDPRCVAACTLGAVRYEPELTAAVSLAEFRPGSRGLSPEAKRLRFAAARFEALRRQWEARRVAGGGR
jgi:Fe-S-cluster-containing hydrogenase component 2